MDSGRGGRAPRTRASFEALPRRRRRGAERATTRTRDFWRDASPARGACIDFGLRRRDVVRARYALAAAGERDRAAHAGGRGHARRCAIPGVHNVRNALAAAACALAAGVPLEAIVRGLERLPAVRRAAAGASAAATARRSSTTATTPTPTRCAPRSTCSPPARRRACWCSATWARSATRARRSTPRSARTRSEAGIDALFALGDARAARGAAFGAGASTSTSIDWRAALAQAAAQLRTHRWSRVALHAHGARGRSA